MSIFKKLSKTLISFFVLASIIITSTSVFAAEIVGRLSVHWSPKHHSAKHAIIFAEEATKRSNGKASDVNLAGFPYHALDNYLPKLVKAGHKVAICEQIEDPSQVKGIVKRKVIEVVTPGTITSPATSRLNGATMSQPRAGSIATTTSCPPAEPRPTCLNERVCALRTGGPATLTPTTALG